MVSPNTITVDLVDVQAHLKPDVQQHEHQESLDELAAFEGDPLEWLIETGVAAEDGGDEKNGPWLPESSLPFFPSLIKDKMQQHDASTTTEAHHDMEGEHRSHVPFAASETMVEDAISNNMVDPNVTVQSLFLPGEATGLL